MRAGRLDRRITIQRASFAANAFNEGKPSWSILATVLAAYEPIRDGERFAAGEVGAHATARFQIRWSSAVKDVNPKDRLIFEGRAHDIVGVKEIGRRVGLEITAAARAD